MWRVLKDFYRATRCKIRVGKGLTEEFSVEKEVKQGAVLSPILFSIFINTLVERLGETGMGVKMGQGTIESLFYADDIVLITNKPEKLQSMLDVVTKYCRRWRCEINRDKSQVVVYGRKRGIRIRKWLLGGGEITQVEAYKYLGIEFERKGGWRKFRERMLRKALRVSGLVKVMCRRNRMLSTDVKIMLWNGLVRPLLEYGAEIWGSRTWVEADRLQKKMGKFFLGVRPTTPDEMVLGDLGWKELRNRRTILRLRYWKKILGMGDERLTKRAYEEDRRRLWQVGSWSKGTKAILEDLGLGEAWEKQDTGGTWAEWAETVEKAMGEKEAKSWNKGCEEKTKLEGYRSVKKEKGKEKYLEVKDKMGRCLMARLRAGTNWLRIEQGRWVGEAREERICRVCEGEVEDESHFLRRCPEYKELRESAQKELRKRTDWKEGKESEEQWEKIFRGGEGTTEMIRIVMEFIKKAVAKRDRALGTEIYKSIRRFEMFSK